MMTFKSIFNRNNFDVHFSSDFCVILAKDKKPLYVVYKNLGIRCLDLYNFEDIQMDMLKNRWIIDNLSQSQEEYELTYSIESSLLINFIFGLIPFDDAICPGIPNPDYWAERLMIRKEEGQAAILLSDMANSYCNVLIFDSGSYRLLLPNTSCSLLMDTGQKNLLVAFNPFGFLNYISAIDINSFASVILPLNVSESIYEALISDRFESYDFICTSIEEYIEALRFCCYYMKWSGIENVDLNICSERGELLFRVLPEAMPLKYVQLGAAVQKNVRLLKETNEPITDFVAKKKDILNSRIYSIPFRISFTNMEVLIDTIICTYKLPCKIL